MRQAIRNIAADRLRHYRRKLNDAKKRLISNEILQKGARELANRGHTNPKILMVLKDSSNPSGILPKQNAKQRRRLEDAKTWIEFYRGVGKRFKPKKRKSPLTIMRNSPRGKKRSSAFERYRSAGLRTRIPNLLTQIARNASAKDLKSARKARDRVLRDAGIESLEVKKNDLLRDIEQYRKNAEIQRLFAPFPKNAPDRWDQLIQETMDKIQRINWRIVHAKQKAKRIVEDAVEEHQATKSKYPELFRRVKKRKPKP